MRSHRRLEGTGEGPEKGEEVPTWWKNGPSLVIAIAVILLVKLVKDYMAWASFDG